MTTQTIRLVIDFQRWFDELIAGPFHALIERSLP